MWTAHARHETTAETNVMVWYRIDLLRVTTTTTIKPRLHQRNLLRATSNKLRAASCLLPATSCVLRATSIKLRATCCAGANAALGYHGLLTLTLTPKSRPGPKLNHGMITVLSLKLLSWSVCNIPLILFMNSDGFPHGYFVWEPCEPHVVY